MSAILFLLFALLACAFGDDTPKTSTPKVDCESISKDTECHGGFKARIVNITTPASGGGLACPAEKLSVVTCPHTPVELDWEYVVPKLNWTTASRKTHAREIPLVVCPLGSKVSFNWKGTVHDVNELPSEEDYNTCNFDKGVNLKHASSSDSFEFHCDKVGTHYFACSVGDACTSGAQKVRVYVSDPVKTVTLRANGGVSLEQFNMKYTLVFAGYFLNKQVLSQNNADQALLDAESILAQSPKSCSDWIPESWNTDQNCRAFVYTDLGFMSRARPDPDFEASERYYRKALEISPGMCGATSYLAELRVQQDRKADADKLYMESCRACGHNSMDFHDLVLSYANRSWTEPNCTAATDASSNLGMSSQAPRTFSGLLHTVTAFFTLAFSWSANLQ
jgi:hypothetical protein